MLPSIVSLPWLPSPPQNFSELCRVIGSSRGSIGTQIQSISGFRLSNQQYLSVARLIEQARRDNADLAPLSDFDLGILSNATFDLLLDFFPAAAARHGIALRSITAAFDQVMQEALDPLSALNRVHLHAMLIAVDHRWFNLDHASLLQQQDKQIEEGLQRLETLVASIHHRRGIPVILQTLAVPPDPLFGNYDRRVAGTVRSMIERVNQRIIMLVE